MDYEGFKKGVFELSGINLDFYKERQMQRRICSLMRKNAYDDFKDYLHALAVMRTLSRIYQLSYDQCFRIL